MTGKWIAYDLDYLAAAFRLREPHVERDNSARCMANDLLYGFIDKAEQYEECLYHSCSAERRGTAYNHA